MRNLRLDGSSRHAPIHLEVVQRRALCRNVRVQLSCKHDRENNEYWLGAMWPLTLPWISITRRVSWKRRNHSCKRALSLIQKTFLVIPLITGRALFPVRACLFMMAWCACSVLVVNIWQIQVSTWLCYRRISCTSWYRMVSCRYQFRIKIKAKKNVFCHNALHLVHLQRAHTSYVRCILNLTWLLHNFIFRHVNCSNTLYRWVNHFRNLVHLLEKSCRNHSKSLEITRNHFEIAGNHFEIAGNHWNRNHQNQEKSKEITRTPKKCREITRNRMKSHGFILDRSLFLTIWHFVLHRFFFAKSKEY